MRTINIFFYFMLCCFFTTTCYAHSPENLYDAKERVSRYHDSGEYARVIEKDIQSAKNYLIQEISANSRSTDPDRLAMILDIDETTLSNYPDMKAMGFGGNAKTFEKEIDKGSSPAITPTLSLYQYAKHHHLSVFFITGRPEHQRAVTIKNLHAAGFTNWDGLFLKPEYYNKKSIVPFKSSARKSLVDQGYHIVLNIGDQLSDLAGDYADYKIKLPNPYYYIP